MRFRDNRDSDPRYVKGVRTRYADENDKPQPKMNRERRRQFGVTRSAGTGRKHRQRIAALRDTIRRTFSPQEDSE